MAESSEKDLRTEEGTPRRKQEAREKGQVPLSTELLAFILLAGWIMALERYGGDLARSAAEVLRGTVTSLATVGTEELDVAAAVAIVSGTLRAGGATTAWLLIPMLLLGVLAGYGQVGFHIAPKAVEFDGSKLDPIKGIGRLFSSRSVVRTLMALAKTLIIAATVVLTAWSQIDKIALLGGADVGPVLAGTGYVVLRCVLAALVAIMALALVDLGFQRFQHGVDLRMTKQEIKEEMKSSEGDPHLRGRIRRVQREMASRRMMADVPKATVVVTNPTHYAVALRYDDEERTARSAPRVVAKGVDFVAQRIKEIAAEADVICYEDVALARALHAQCEIGDQVPDDLFQAVASVLAYVYSLQGAPEAKEAAL